MTFRRSALAITAALIMIPLQTTAFASVASENHAFNAIVAQAVRSLNNDYVQQMSASERRTWNACVQKIYAGVPQGRKRYVLDGRSAKDRLARLDEVSRDNHAAVRQAIAKDC